MSGDRHLIQARRENLAPEDLAVLENWTREFPEFRDIWEVKERCHEIWDTTAKADPRAKYDEWRESLSPLAREAFGPLMDRINCWQAEIFGALRVTLTTDPAEMATALGRLADRVGRGYAFEALKAKLLLDRNAWIVRGKGGDDGAPVSTSRRLPVAVLGICIATLERGAHDSQQV